MLKLSMKPTGWFHIGWSEEIPPGGVKPLKYFGHELVAFRSESGELAVTEAHCPHLGAHLGYGGKVVGDCIQCPYHGWKWNTRGENAHIPYQERTVNRKLKKWAVIEQHEMIFMWHDPAGGPPREGWTLPHIFDLEGLPADPEDFYPCYRNGVHLFYPGERIHPQLIVENAADSAHFRYTHGAPEDPELIWFDNATPVWKSEVAFYSPKTKQVAMRGHARNPGVGLSFFVFDHAGFGRRLVLSSTPIDDESCDVRVTYFFPKDPNSPDAMPEHVRRTAAETRMFFEQDAEIWRHQRFVRRPIFADRDVKGYTGLRRWSEQFYEVEDAPAGPMQVVDEVVQ
jgi:phenylpropionate dioxygenase-like ring-hydroxylating dioxygenase large terminal subunit